MASKHTTVRLKPALLRKVKAYARDHDLTMTAVMERALLAYIAAPLQRKATHAHVLPSFGVGGTRPGINLDDTSALMDIMDGIE